MIRGIRGATTLDDNTAETMERETIRLLSALVTENQIAITDIVTVFFTLTADLTKQNPAQAARRHFDWKHVPMVCALEPDIEGFPPRCLRVLIQFETPRPQTDLTPVYLNGAVALRPDLAED